MSEADMSGQIPIPDDEQDVTVDTDPDAVTNLAHTEDGAENPDALAGEDVDDGLDDDADGETDEDTG